MKPQQIKAKLVERGIKQADIARSLHVSRMAVNRTINGKDRSARIERAIARKLKLPVSLLFQRKRRAA